jgi:hypothetical protein
MPGLADPQTKMELLVLTSKILNDLLLEMTSCSSLESDIPFAALEAPEVVRSSQAPCDQLELHCSPLGMTGLGRLSCVSWTANRMRKKTH